MPLKKGMIDESDPRVTLIGHPAPAWMVNYADLMTELVCFFVVLYALSAALNKDVQQAKKDVTEKMKQEHVSGGVGVTKDGMTITIEEKGENVLFESGSSELSPRMKEILATLGPSIKPLAKDHEIIIEGHTDNLPIHSAQFPSNWDLSTARATNVVKYMINHMDFPAKRFGAIGYGEFHPLVPNDSDEHRATNRRVVFFVKNAITAPPKPDTKKPAESAAEAPVKTDTVSDATAGTSDPATTVPTDPAPAADAAPTETTPAQ